MKGCIVLVIGLPASGKSTFTTKLVNYIAINHVDMKPLYLDFDKVIPLETQKLIVVNQLDSSWKETRGHFVSSCQAFLNLILNSNSESGSNLIQDETKYLEKIISQLSMVNIGDNDYFCFIVEDNFYYKSMREQFFRLSRQFKLGLLMIMITTSVDSCLKRNEIRSNAVENKIINRMADCFERPTRDEFGIQVGKRIQLMEINCDNDELTDIIHYVTTVKAIRDACNNPIDGINYDDSKQMESREASREVTADNLVHRFDKLLRVSVNRMMVMDKSVIVNCSNGKVISMIRKKLLRKFSDNQLDNDDGLREELMATGELSNERLIEMALDLIKSELEGKMEENH